MRDEFEGCRVLHALPTLDEGDGGLPRAVVSLASKFARNQNGRVGLVTQSRPSSQCVALKNVEIEVVSIKTSFIEKYFGIKLRRYLRRSLDQGSITIIHNHGIWTPFNFWVSLVGLKNRICVITQPHGMLEAWSLEQKKFKKYLALLLYQKFLLRRADLFIATSEQECHSIRKLGLRQPVAVIPHGISSPVLELGLKKQNASKEEKKTLLFLSRIHPKKGVLDLLMAWESLAGKYSSNWKLVIAGNFDKREKRYVSKIKSFHEAMKNKDSVSLIGEVGDAEKWGLFSRADLFILPSYSENFGLVVLEALASGLPVIVGSNASWSNLPDMGCGWLTNQGAENLEKVLDIALSQSDQDLLEMGLKAVAFSRKFDWGLISAHFNDTYKWALGLGSRPSIVNVIE